MLGPLPMNNPEGIRMSTALTYINPIRHRLNLSVRANVFVRAHSCSTVIGRLKLK